jgi:anti-sigma factor RsiW
MKHEDAIQTEAVERYLLGEMTEDEQGIFEEHYFDCPVCSADVTDGTRMMIAGKVVVEAERAAEKAQPSNVVPMPMPKPKPPKPPWWFPVAAAASLVLPLLGGGVGYQLAQNRLRPAPTELVRVVRLETGVSRSGTPAEIPTVRPGDDLRFEVEPKDEAVAYAATVTCGGKTESTHGISWEMAAEAVSLRIGELPAGRCELVIEGVRKDGKPFPITSKPFQVGER